MNPTDTFSLETLKTVPLSTAEYYYRQGLIGQDTYDAYLHLWQTSAPRFSLQACHCIECMKNPVERF